MPGSGAASRRDRNVRDEIVLLEREREVYSGEMGHPLRERETQPVVARIRTRIRRSPERLGQPIELLAAHSDAGVCDPDQSELIARCDLPVDLTSSWAVLDCVAKEIRKNDPQGFVIGLDLRPIGTIA